MKLKGNNLFYVFLIICWFIIAFAIGFARGDTVQVFELSSSAFKDESSIPKRYTCDGQDVSPPLSWGGPPGGTKTFCLICDDPDAPAGTWAHWVIYDIPSGTRGLPEDVPKERRLKNGSKQGTNDFGRIGYGGPCPPRGGPHRYFFKLYALDTVLDLPRGETKSDLETAMEGHDLGFTKLVGFYGR